MAECAGSSKCDPRIIPAAPQFTEEERAKRRRISEVDALQRRLRDDPIPSEAKPVAQVDILARLERAVEAAHGVEGVATHHEISARKPFDVLAGGRSHAEM